MLPLCQTLHRRENIQFPKGRHPILVVFGLAAVWRFRFQTKTTKKLKNKNKIKRTEGHKGREKNKKKSRKQLLNPLSFTFFFVIKNWNDGPRTSMTAQLLVTWWSNKEQNPRRRCEAFQRGNREPTISFTTRNKNTKITGFLFDVKSLWGKKHKKREQKQRWGWYLHENDDEPQLKNNIKAALIFYQNYE